MRLSLIALVAVAACASPKERADTTIPAIDTLKAATDSMPARDTTSAAPVATKTAPVPGLPPARTETTSAKQPTATKDTAHLGRDRAIKINPRDPRRQLPTVDTTKKPPSR